MLIEVIWFNQQERRPQTKKNELLVSAIIISTTDPSGILITFKHSQISDTCGHFTLQYSSSGIAVRWLKMGEDGKTFDILLIIPAARRPGRGSEIQINTLLFNHYMHVYKYTYIHIYILM